MRVLMLLCCLRCLELVAADIDALAAYYQKRVQSDQALARYLKQKGVHVQVYLLAKMESVQGDALTNLGFLKPLDVPVVEIPDEASMLSRGILKNDLTLSPRGLSEPSISNTVTLGSSIGSPSPSCSLSA